MNRKKLLHSEMADGNQGARNHLQVVRKCSLRLEILHHQLQRTIENRNEQQREVDRLFSLNDNDRYGETACKLMEIIEMEDAREEAITCESKLI